MADNEAAQPHMQAIAGIESGLGEPPANKRRRRKRND